ncbi:MAG: ABC transporter substrate-binding protein [Deltaproteobacteria bacterium]|nr:ABC transporter substrate-binding protein [Deltaproteobacteria bacterium]
MTRRLKTLLVSLPAFVCLFSSQTGFAQDRLRIAWSGSSPAHTPIWVVEEKNLLKKNGIDGEVISINASSIAVQVLLAGEVDVIIGSVANLTSRLAGGDTIMILGLVPTFVDHLITHPSITKIEQLKGKVGAVNRAGTSSELGIKLTLRRLGIDPDREVKLVPRGGNPERLAAISQGIAQFTHMPEPFVREADRLGFRDLLDIGALKIPFHWNGAMTREAVIKAKRPVIARYARAMVESIHFIKTNKEATKAILAKRLRMDDPDGLERAYKAYSVIFREAPYPYVEGVKTFMDDLAITNPKAATVDLSKYVDMSFVQELESSGFIKQMYKPTAVK